MFDKLFGASNSDALMGQQSPQSPANPFANMTISNPMGGGAITATSGLYPSAGMVQQAMGGYQPRKNLALSLHEIKNGYILKVDGQEYFVKELADVGGVIVTEWAKLVLGD